MEPACSSEFRSCWSIKLTSKIIHRRLSTPRAANAPRASGSFGDNQPDLSKIEQRRGTGRDRLAAERRGSSLAPFPKMAPASPPNWGRFLSPDVIAKLVRGIARAAARIGRGDGGPIKRLSAGRPHRPPRGLKSAASIQFHFLEQAAMRAAKDRTLLGANRLVCLTPTRLHREIISAAAMTPVISRDEFKDARRALLRSSPPSTRSWFDSSLVRMPL
jgi:hypothetical protein